VTLRRHVASDAQVLTGGRWSVEGCIPTRTVRRLDVGTIKNTKSCMWWASVTCSIKRRICAVQAFAWWGSLAQPARSEPSCELPSGANANPCHRLPALYARNSCAKTLPVWV